MKANTPSRCQFLLYCKQIAANILWKCQEFVQYWDKFVFIIFFMETKSRESLKFCCFTRSCKNVQIHILDIQNSHFRLRRLMSLLFIHLSRSSFELIRRFHEAYHSIASHKINWTFKILYCAIKTSRRNIAAMTAEFLNWHNLHSALIQFALVQFT